MVFAVFANTQRLQLHLQLPVPQQIKPLPDLKALHVFYSVVLPQLFSEKIISGNKLTVVY